MLKIVFTILNNLRTSRIKRKSPCTIFMVFIWRVYVRSQSSEEDVLRSRELWTRSRRKWCAWVFQLVHYQWTSAAASPGHRRESIGRGHLLPHRTGPATSGRALPPTGRCTKEERARPHTPDTYVHFVKSPAKGCFFVVFRTLHTHTHTTLSFAVKKVLFENYEYGSLLNEKISGRLQIECSKI